MKPGHWIAFALIGFLCFVGFGPYYTIREIKSGLQNKDSKQLSDNIDFPLVRQSLKEQMDAQLVKTATGKEANVFSGLATLFAGKLVEVFVDKVVTPAGLAMMTTGEKPNPLSGTGKSDQRHQPFDNVRYAFDSMSRFSAYVPTKDGKEIRFVLTRYWLNWKLTDVILPLEI